MSWFAAYFAIGWTIRLAMIPTVLRRDLAPGASIAWLGVIFLHPYVGLSLYLLFGETRLGPGRVKEHLDLVAHFRAAPASRPVIGSAHSPVLTTPYEPMVLQTQHIGRMPVLGSNQVDFMQPIAQVVERLVTDINSATSHVHLLYYMFAHDSTGDAVATALEAAVRRGVHCRVLVDAVASRKFLGWRGLGRRLSKAGVQVAGALPANLIARRLPRMDLRNHRKLAIIDDRIAYAGSHNLINPDYDGSPAGPWVDVTGRLAGPIAAALSLVFAEDWGFETGEILPAATINAPTNLDQGVPIQAAPTGPTDSSRTYRRILLAAIQSARHRLMLTTPYFVPDEPTLVSLMMAADRGVEVTLILPMHPDHLFTAAAGRAHFSRLLEAGVAIHLFHPGLLHAKTTTVDDAFALFGSANLDVRSFHLNFELSLLLYGAEVTARLRAIQAGFLADSQRLEPRQWGSRPVLRQYTDRAISLLSPLL